MRKRVRVGGKNIPAVLFVVVALTILPIGVVYGQSAGSAGAEGVSTDPYGVAAGGAEQTGLRLSADGAGADEALYYWSVRVNGHKHATAEEWKKCPNNTDEDTQNDDVAPPQNTDGTFTETFTIAVSGENTAPAWLREAAEGEGKPALKENSPLTVNRGGGLYGMSSADTSGPAYFKLFYVNSEVVWKDLVDKEDSAYKTPFGDWKDGHRPTKEHPVGAYDALYTNKTLSDGEADALLFAPGGKAAEYLTPVPVSDIKAIAMTDTGFEIEMRTSAVLGKTLSVAWMTNLAADESGMYNAKVRSAVTVAGKTVGDLSVATAAGTDLENAGKGKFVIDLYDLETALPLKDVTFDVAAESEDGALADAAKAKIEGTSAAKETGAEEGTGADTAEGTSAGTAKVNKTDANGRLKIELPQLPWDGGKNLKLTVKEKAPETHIGAQAFVVELEPVNGTVVSVETAPGDEKLLLKAPGRYGVRIWNKSVVSDTGFYDAALRTWIKKVDREGKNIFYEENPNAETASVKNGDTILYRVDIYNQCLKDIVVPEITVQIPAGLSFDAAAKIAHIDPAQPAYTNSDWEVVSGGDGSNVTLRYKGEKLRLYPWDGAGASYPEWRIPLVLTVSAAEDTADGTILTTIAEISKLQDYEEVDVADADSTPDTDMNNDGAAPDVSYGSAPEGSVVSSDIESHRNYADGITDMSQDEDDHDYAAVKFSAV